MPVTVQHRCDTRVTGPRGDLIRVRTRGDPPRHRGVSQVVDAQGREAGALEGGEPEAATPCPSTHRAATRRREDQIIRRETSRVVREYGREVGRDRDGSPTGASLRLADVDLPAHLVGDLDDL